MGALLQGIAGATKFDRAAVRGSTSLGVVLVRPIDMGTPGNRLFPFSTTNPRQSVRLDIRQARGFCCEGQPYTAAGSPF